MIVMNTNIIRSEKVRQRQKCLEDFRKQTPYLNIYYMGKISYQSISRKLPFKKIINTWKETVFLISRTRRECQIF